MLSSAAKLVHLPTPMSDKTSQTVEIKAAPPEKIGAPSKKIALTVQKISELPHLGTELPKLGGEQPELKGELSMLRSELAWKIGEPTETISELLSHLAPFDHQTA